MLSTRSFLRDQDGAVTIWLLMWSILFIGFAGLAVDVSNAYRTRAMLQATADAAAHAGAIRLAGGGTEAEVDAEAISYAQTNLPVARNGTVVLPADVTLVTYIPDPDNPGNGQAYTAMADKNAVRVIAQRATVEGELTKVPLPTSLLRIIDFNSWNITVEAIAALGGGMCSGKANWMLALTEVTFTSNTGFDGDLCVYGKLGIDGNMGNYATSSVVFGWGNESDPNVYGWSVMDCADCDRRGSLEITETEDAKIVAIIETMVNQTRDNVVGAPDYELHKVKKGDKPEDLIGPALAGGANTFHITCNQDNVDIDLEKVVAAANKYALDNGLNPVTSLQNVTFYSGPSAIFDPNEGVGCRFAGANLYMQAVTIATTNIEGGALDDPGGSEDSKTKSGSVRLNGQPVVVGGCVDGETEWEEGLRIFSLGGINFTAEGNFNTLQMYAKKNINFTAGANMDGAVDVRSAQGISFTANGTFLPSCVAAEDITSEWDIDAVRIVY